jgi:hypothetical protein
MRTLGRPARNVSSPAANQHGGSTAGLQLVRPPPWMIDGTVT